MKYKISSLLALLILNLFAAEKADFSQFSAINDPVLNQIAEEIPDDQITSDETQDIVNRMLEIAEPYHDVDQSFFMVGLAAPQVGISKRIILVDEFTTRQQKVNAPFLVLINPEIIEKSDEITEETFEGCFSAGNVIGIVPRFQKIKVRAYNVDGELLEKEYEGFLARIIQHEIDHLNGLRFPDRVTDETKLHWIEDGELKEYRENYQNWKRIVTKKEWAKISGKNS